MCLFASLISLSRSRSIAVSRFRYLNKVMSSQTGSMLVQRLLAACTAGVERQRQELLHALRHYALWAKIILADFNLAVSPPTAKHSSLSNFPAIWYIYLHQEWSRV